MISVETLAELASHVGETLGCSDWLVVDQEMINRFADVTGDRNWYHLDQARAARELPGGATIAHGLLTLSLVLGLSGQIVTARRHGRALNYGFNKVRFPEPVPAGGEVRLWMKVQSAAPAPGGLMLTRYYTLELKGAAKPAVAAEMLTLIFD